MVYDSFLRERQTQQLSPTTGQVLVTGTSYTNRGMVDTTGYPQAADGTPGQGLISVNAENKTRTLYDPLGRPARAEYFRIENGTPTFKWASTTSYLYDPATGLFATVVIPPEGSRTRTFTDGLGRTVRVDEEDTAGTSPTVWSPTQTRSTSYTYDLSDNLTSVIDPANNTIRYGYDMAGRRIGMDDPDAGATADPNTWGWSYGYDPVR